LRKSTIFFNKKRLQVDYRKNLPSFILNKKCTFAKKNIIMAAAILLGPIGPWQLVLIGIIVLLFFGGRKIPELMKGLGKGVKSFKDGMKDDDDSEESDTKNNKK